MNNSIIPGLKDIASKTERFPIHATRLRRFPGGLDIKLTHVAGGVKYDEASNGFSIKGLEVGIPQSKSIERWMRALWGRKGENWLGGRGKNDRNAKYVLLSSAEPRAAEKAWATLKDTFEGAHGTVEGLGLWLNKNGSWHLKKKFNFQPAK